MFGQQNSYSKGPKSLPMPTVEKSEIKKPRTGRGFPGHVTTERQHDIILAEQEGFEPSVGDYPTHAFQACDLNHSSTAPRGAHCSKKGGPVK